MRVRAQKGSKRINSLSFLHLTLSLRVSRSRGRGNNSESASASARKRGRELARINLPLSFLYLTLSLLNLNLISSGRSGGENSASESASERKKGVRPFSALFLLITNYKLRITAHRVGHSLSPPFPFGQNTEHRTHLLSPITHHSQLFPDVSQHFFLFRSQGCLVQQVRPLCQGFHQFHFHSPFRDFPMVAG